MLTVQEALLLHEAHKEGFQKKTREKLARTFPIAAVGHWVW